MLAHRLEAHRREEPGRDDTRRLRRVRVPEISECLNSADPAPHHVLGRGLDQYPPETLTGELRNHPGRHEHYRVDSDRGGREGSRARHEIRWGVSDVTGGDPVDVRDLADAAPLEQCRGQP